MTDYKTTDIAFAAYLKLNKIPFIGILRDDKTRSRFYFVFQDALGTLSDNYNNFLLGELLVDPNEFHQTVRNLTTLVKGHQ